MNSATEVPLSEVGAGLETIFKAHYGRICRVIAGVLKDPARAEELAVEVFLKWSKTPNAQGSGAEAWMYRAAVRRALDEIRHQERRRRYERIVEFVRRAPSPHAQLEAREETRNVRIVLTRLPERQAALLLLRSHGFSYQELAAALDLNSSSVGTLLARAQQAFKKEYIERYGER